MEDLRRFGKVRNYIQLTEVIEIHRNTSLMIHTLKTMEARYTG